MTYNVFGGTLNPAQYSIFLSELGRSFAVILVDVNRSERLRWIQAVTPQESDEDGERIYDEWGMYAKQQIKSKITLFSGVCCERISDTLWHLSHACISCVSILVMKHDWCKNCCVSGCPSLCHLR